MHLDLAEQFAHPRQGLITVRALGDDFGDHRIVVAPNLVALLKAAVHPHAVRAEAEGASSRRDAPSPDRAAVWNEVVVWTLRVEPRLDRVTLADSCPHCFHCLARATMTQPQLHDQQLIG